jgi:Protein of unknown function (DUF4239)
METWLLLHFPTWLLLLGIVVVSVGGSLLGLWFVRKNVELSSLEAHHEVAGFILAVVGVVYAVLLAFVVVIVWQEFDNARADASREASSLLAVYRDAGLLTPPGPDARPVIARYAHLVVDDEWPVMAKQHTDSATTDVALDDVWSAIREIKPRNDADTALLGQTISSLQDASELRRERINEAGTDLPSSLLTVLLVGAIISIGFTYFFGVEKFAPQILMVGSLAALVGLVLALILTLDLPFTGDLGVQPDAMRSAIVEFPHMAR